MIKVQWDDASDPHKHNFVVCNRESAFSLLHVLLNANIDGGCAPINVRVFDLSGREFDLSEPWDRINGEWTHS